MNDERQKIIDQAATLSEREKARNRKLNKAQMEAEDLEEIYNESYNILPGVDDMEFVDELDLDPNVAYTPAINDAILDAIHVKNYEFYLADGYNEKQAKQMADARRRQADAAVQDVMRQRAKNKGTG